MKHRQLPAREERRDWNAHQRAGLITILLRGGSKLTTDGVARVTGLTWEGAEYMMNMLSAVIPIVKTNGMWQWMDDGEM